MSESKTGTVEPALTLGETEKRTLVQVMLWAAALVEEQPELWDEDFHVCFLSLLDHACPNLAVRRFVSGCVEDRIRLVRSGLSEEDTLYRPSRESWQKIEEEAEAAAAAV